MSISLLGQYGAGRVFVDAENVRGTFKDSTFPGAFDGTPAQYAWARDVWGFLEILLDKASIIPNGSPDTAVTNQRYDALEKIVRDVFPVWDSGHVYAKGVLALASDDKLYQSQQSGNLGHDPVSSPAWWLVFSAYGDATTTTKGVVELSTPAENVAGTSDLVVPTAKGIREALNAAGSAPVFAGRTWVNFDGTGAITIRGSGNVSSITDESTGRYTINFATNLEDINYAVAATAGNSVLANNNRVAAVDTYTVSSVTIQTRNASTAGNTDVEFVNLAIFR